MDVQTNLNTVLSMYCRFSKRGQVILVAILALLIHRMLAQDAGVTRVKVFVGFATLRRIITLHRFP